MNTAIVQPSSMEDSLSIPSTPTPPPPPPPPPRPPKDIQKPIWNRSQPNNGKNKHNNQGGGVATWRAIKMPID